MNKISAILLLSGYAKRFNSQNKLLAKINNKCVVDYVLSVVADFNFFEVIAVCRDNLLIEKAKEYGCKVIENNNAQNGISESIKLGVLNSLKEGRGYMFFQGDQIFITEEDIKLLTDEFNKNSNKIIIPTYNNIECSPVIFPNSFRDNLLLLTGDSGGRVVINNNRDKIKLVEIKNKNVAIDIDTIDDFNKVKNMLE